MDTERHASAASLSECVDAARRGDDVAFEELVRRHQAMAIATAFGWLGDLQWAQDVAQEAFTEAYLNLDQLRESAAFPGFLRRIVLKHSDRLTRRRRPVPFDPSDAGAALRATAPDDASNHPEERFERRDAQARVRALIGALPPHERVVVALHSLAGVSQRDVAAWLALPIGTVKKRLHAARERIQGGLVSMTGEALELLRPAEVDTLCEVLRLFLAVRENRTDRVQALLESRPDLVEAEERWDSEITRMHALPVPTGGTPLVRAAERGHVEMVDLLVAKGASVDRACPCEGGESPLWAAAANGQRGAARKLLELGADPDARAFAAHTPLHVAAIRGDTDLAGILLEFGADASLRDANGRIAADWARDKGDPSLADLLSAPGAASPSRSESRKNANEPAADASSALFETGIKAVDLLVPIARGARVHVPHAPGLGAVVLTAELTRRHCDATSASRAASVWIGWERQATDRGEIVHALEEANLGERVALVFSPIGDSDRERRATAEYGMDEARRIQTTGVDHVLVVVFQHPAFEAETLAMLARVGHDGSRSTTALVLERDPKVFDPAGPPAGFDARIAFDAGAAALRLYPAIDPVASHSEALSSGGLDALHAALLDDVRAVRESGDPRWARLRAYLTQPFSGTEAFTGRPAPTVTRRQVLSDARRILDGETDAMDPGRLGYGGSLDEVLARG